MDSILMELKKMKSELTLQEIDFAMELLLKEKENIYRKSIKDKRKKIVQFEREISRVKIQIGNKIGTIEINDISLPDRAYINNIPKQKHAYFVVENGHYYCTMTPNGKIYRYRGLGHLHPTIIYENKSDFELNVGDTFLINEEEFIVIGKNIAFKKQRLEGKYELYVANCARERELYWWYYSLVNEAYRRTKLDGDKLYGKRYF